MSFARYVELHQKQLFIYLLAAATPNVYGAWWHHEFDVQRHTRAPGAVRDRWRLVAGHGG